MKIGFISSDDLCLPLLQFLKNSNADITVFSDPAPGNNTGFQAAAHFCAAASITVEAGHNDPSRLYTWIDAVRPDMIFILGYRHLINTAMLSERLLKNTFNIHFGALPEFRGATPVFWQLRSGAPYITITIQRINHKFDAGEIVWTKQIPREPHFSYGFVNMLLSHVSIEGAAHIINNIAQGKHPSGIPQDTSAAHYFPRPRLKDVLIDWNKMIATEINHLVLACNPWNKGAISIFKGNEIKVVDVIHDTANALSSGAAPGTIVNNNGVLHIACAGGETVGITMLCINDMFIPARHADKFGIVTGQKLG